MDPLQFALAFSAFLIPLPALWLIFRSRDLIRWIFLLLSFSLSIFAAASIWQLLEGEWFLLLSGPLLIHLAHLFPGRSSLRSQEKERRRPFLLEGAIFWLAALVLCLLLYFFREAVLWILRLFLFLCLLFAIREQRFFLRARHQDPRKAYSRYLISVLLLILVSGLVFFIAHESGFLDSPAPLPVLLLVASVTVAFILDYRAVAFRDIHYRAALLLIITGLLLLPLYFLITSLLGIMYATTISRIGLVLCLIFIAFQMLQSQLLPLGYRLLLPRRSRTEEILKSFRQSMATLQSASVEAELLKLLDTLYEPGFFVCYRPREGHIIQTRELTRLPQSDRFPPAALSPELVRLVQTHPHLLIFDLQSRAREENGRLQSELGALSALGAEFIWIIGQEEPLSVIVAGLARDGHPFDHSDLEQLHSIESATALSIRNQRLLSSVENLKQRLQEENQRISSQLTRSASLPAALRSAAFVYAPDGPMQTIMAELERLAPQNSPLLLCGETGTGKEQLARFVHMESGRSGPWVAINCAALPADLLENELFGHEMGAYTGATTERSGLVERASEGTLFLDEISEMPLSGQAKLLRLVQEGEYERLGGSAVRKSTARLIFATNSDLSVEVKENRFREDLYYRIAAFEVQLPPLRQRQQDLPLLIDHFLLIYSEELGREKPELTDETRAILLRYGWPGNVRELENILLRTLVLARTNRLTPADLPVAFSAGSDFEEKKEKLARLEKERENLEKEMLLQALEEAGGNQREAARLLSISRGALQYRLKNAGIG